MNFKKELIAKLGDPHSNEALNEYIMLIESKQSTSVNSCGGVQYHHILPRSIFPEYEKSHANIVGLSYDDHIKAHELLYKAFPCKEFQRPLNFMQPRTMTDDEYAEHRSIAAKKSWAKLKADPVKFNKFRKARSAHMRSDKNVSDYKAMAAKANTPEKRASSSRAMKEYWISDRSNEHRNNLVAYLKSEKHSKIVSSNSKKQWEKEPADSARRKQASKLAKENVRRNAKINKKLWATDEYREKMRKARSGIFWWTDGVREMKSRTQPDGMVRGRLKRKTA